MNSQAQEEFLAKCTVRLQAAGKSGYGTGFFVAPSLILTCAHVVRKNQQIVPQIKLWWQGKEYQAEVECIPDANQAVDIALLKVSNLVNQDWLISDFDFSGNTGDEVYTFGYPDHNQDGEPGTFEVVGFTGNQPPLIKFKEGQVRPGFSGSPLLNLRTGKVCGMISKTLDRSTDLGGKGVPTSVIFTYFPELNQTQANTIADNPFIPLSGKINSADAVFGREKDLNRIFAHLNGGSGVALIGQSGVGKSSLLQVVYEQAQSKLYIPRRPIYLNLGRCLDNDSFYAKLCGLIGIEFNDQDPLKIRKFDRQIAEHRLLLIFDGIHQMTWEKFTNPVREHIRALADEGDNSPLRLVVAAQKPLSVLFPDSSDKTSPFQNVCTELPVRHWQEPIIRDFICHKLANNLITFSEAEIEKIIIDSQGLPQKVMQLCSDLYQTLSVN